MTQDFIGLSCEQQKTLLLSCLSWTVKHAAGHRMINTQLLATKTTHCHAKCDEKTEQKSKTGDIVK